MGDLASLTVGQGLQSMGKWRKHTLSLCFLHSQVKHALPFCPRPNAFISIQNKQATGTMNSPRPLLLVFFAGIVATGASGTDSQAGIFLVIAVAALIGMLDFSGLYWQEKNNKKHITAQLARVQHMVELAPIDMLLLDANLRVLAGSQQSLRAFQQTRCPFLLTAGTFPPALLAYTKMDEWLQQQAAYAAITFPPRPDSQPEEEHIVLDELVPLPQDLHLQDAVIWYGYKEAVKVNNEATEKPRDPEEIDAILKEFLAQISHEIRTPLNAIIGYAEMLGQSELDAKQQRFTQNIRKSSLALADIAADLFGKGKQNLAVPLEQPIMQIQPAEMRLDLPKLLVIDDSVLIRELFMDIFPDSEYSVLTAETGEAGIQICQSLEPDLIFLDMNLPDMDGLQVAQLLKNEPTTATIPLVVMTGKELKEIKDKDLFDDFLLKPFSLGTLRNTVAARLGEEKKNNVSPLLPQGEQGLTSVEPAWQKTLAELRPHWHSTPRALLASIKHSGQLNQAIELGVLLQNEADLHHLSRMKSIGEELVDYASEPNIAALEHLVAQLWTLNEEKEEACP